jgi:hypothetical protein
MPSPRTKPPAANRSVPILDRIQKRLSPVEAARQTVELTIDRPIGKARRLATVAQVIKTMADGSPVVVVGRFPMLGPRLAKTDVTGYFTLNGHGTLARTPRTAWGRSAIVLMVYSKKRDAVRFTPALGRGWGQSGRAWLTTKDLRQLLSNGARAFAPEKGPIP